MYRLIIALLCALSVDVLFASVQDDIETPNRSWMSAAETEIVQSYGLKKTDVILGVLGVLDGPVFYQLAGACGGLSQKVHFLNNNAARTACGAGAGTSIAFGVGVFAAKTSEKYLPSDMTDKNYDVSRWSHCAELIVYLATGVTACIPLFYLNQVLFPGADAVLSAPGHIAFSAAAALIAGVSYIWGLHTVTHEWVIDPVSSLWKRWSRPGDYNLMDNTTTLDIKKLEQLTTDVFEFSAEELQEWQSHIQKERFNIEHFLEMVRDQVEHQEQVSSYPEKMIASLSAIVGVLSGYANWPLSVIAVAGFVDYMGGNGHGVSAKILGNMVGLAGFLSLGSINFVGGYITGKSIYQAVIGIPAAVSSWPSRIWNYFTEPAPVKEKLEPVIDSTLNIAALYLAASSAMPQMAIALMAVNPGVWNIILQTCAAVGGTATAWFSMRRIIHMFYNNFFADDVTLGRELLQFRAQEVAKRLGKLKIA